MTVLVEGIETQSDQVEIINMGCQLGQGSYLGPFVISRYDLNRNDWLRWVYLNNRLFSANDFIFSGVFCGIKRLVCPT